MWIETDTYIGPCRRTGLARKPFRLFNRRHGDAGDRMPSLPSLLRQLRANAQNLTEELDRRRFRLRLKATIDLARRLQANATAVQLEKLNKAMTDAALMDRRSVPVIETFLEAASAALPR